MKRIMILALLAVFALTVNAQHETLFGNARVVGGFGAPIIEWGLGNDLTTSVGGGGAPPKWRASGGGPQVDGWPSRRATRVLGATQR